MSGSGRAVGLWLLGCSALLAVMVWLGGVTRLTHSGLSMVEWEPIVGLVPPLSEADWQRLFALYRQTPEYLKINAGMGLEGFKGIFWLEYVHRLWGRLLGLAFLLPLLWFLGRGHIGRGLALRLCGLFLLGAAQGGVGWLMVQSGLVDDPSVSPYRLTAHLCLALLIFAGMLWLALDQLGESRPAGPMPVQALRPWLAVLCALVALTIAFGGLVAGHHAGLIYNTWPLMEGRLIPDGLFPDGPASLVSDIKTVQFIHRCLAETVVAVVLLGALAWVRRRASVPWQVQALPGMTLMQAGLGIATLKEAVPVVLASAHQMGAMLLLALCLSGLHALRVRE